MQSDEEVFAEAVGLSGEARRALLDRVGAADPGQRARLEDLLAAFATAERMLPEPLVALGTLGAEEKPGDMIGRYQLRDRLGEGGCGVVWRAEQHEPVRREVALKIIKLGMDTREVVARFEAERQALALMDHPAIARVYDAGATAAGRPFFVMEVVRGLPITRFCDEQALTPRARLELFLQVCQAVQHAHQKGIIHRDLKPSNILVANADGAAVPKVIDFGIAKATQGRLTDATLRTQVEQFMGTPVYMSPEQAERGGVDIDTRSDIYSLGVLLYELLTGGVPFAPKTLREAGLDEVRRIIREIEPPRPSTRLRTLGAADRAAVARQRQVSPAQLAVVLHSDLDWIVMHCLEKDRARRYETMAALAADVRHYLRDEPVVARPPGLGYRLGKLVRRHRVAFGASVAVGTALMVGLMLAARAYQAEAAARADISRVFARVVALAETRGPRITLKDVLDDTARWGAETFSRDPRAQAKFHAALGETYTKLSFFDSAEPHLAIARDLRRRLLGGEHPDTLASDRAWAAHRVNRHYYNEGEPILQRVVAAHERMFGADAEETLITWNEIVRAQLERNHLERGASDYAQRLATTDTLARRCLARAEARFGPIHLLTLMHLQNVVDATIARRGCEAEPFAGAVYRRTAAVLGEEHPETLLALHNWIRIHSCGHPREETEALERKCIALEERVLGPDHWLTAWTCHFLGGNLDKQRRTDEADALRIRVTASWLRTYSADDRAQFANLVNLTTRLNAHRKGAEAARFAGEWLTPVRARVAANHPNLGAILIMAAVGHLSQNQREAAAPLLVEGVAVLQQMRCDYSAHARALADLGNVLRHYRRFAEAEALLLTAHRELQRWGEVPALASTVEALIELNTAWARPAEVARWQEALERCKASLAKRS